MKTRPALSLLGLACLMLVAPGVRSQEEPKVPEGCVLGDMLTMDQAPFPDIEKLAVDSYQMTVEFTIPKAKQTDYYTEFYDILLGRGRVDSHQDGKNLQYIYQQETWEAWNLEGDKCELQNVTDVPDLFKDYQMNWVFVPDSDQQQYRTVGPSAMFKLAYQQWNRGDTVEKRSMAYLGELHGPIRGIRAQAWRWCQTPTTSIDYFFTVNDTDNAYDLKSMRLFPLRVAFNGRWTGDDADLSEQYYDIMNFQPYISLGIHPFQLPKGKNCQRGGALYPPTLPDYSTKNMLFSAEVLYRKVQAKGKDDIVSFYSNLRFAIDRETQTLSYFYAPWNSTKVKTDDGVEEDDFDMDSPEYVIYDMEYNYAYKTNYENGQCTISRNKKFIPAYRLPLKGGSISLTDPYILFPNNELSYLTRGYDRGLDVDIFEAYVENYVLSADTLVEKAIITHSYLRDNEILENNVAVKNAPTQIEVRFFRTKGEEEILTFNFFGFSTKLYNKKRLFDITRCFKNDDDYSWVTFGFELADDKSVDLTTIPVRDIQRNIMSYLDIDVNIKPMRVPTVMVDTTKELFISLLLLEKPPLPLDFTYMEADKTIATTDIQGLADYSTCATACLEQKKNCWGFALCGKECFYGTSPDAKVTTQKDCILHKRFNNETYLRSKDSVIEDMQGQVERGNVKLTLDVGDTQIKLKATSIDVTDPAEDDTTFQKMGHELSPRMRVLKVGAKLKKGTTVKNLGKLMFSECQKVCLDFKDCETVSFCMIDSDCVITSKYGDEIKDDDRVDDQMCQLVTRKYADNFDRSPGLFLSVDASSTKDIEDTEDCARACLKETSFKCLSFDHCPREKKGQCRLHKVHFLNKKAKKESLDSKPTCGHYSRKYSSSFKKSAESRVVGSTVPPITNLTLEECAKACVEYEEGGCYGFDFCQGSSIYATSCLLINSDPSRLENTYSSVCSNFLRTEVEYAPRPYSTSYAGGIGFLCFLIGGVVGAIVVFVIAYIRVNRR